MIKQRTIGPVRKGVARVPVIMQMETLECGAAALAMILAYYGKWIPLEQVRVDCGVSRDGSNARNILRAARNYGLSVKAFRKEPENLRANGPFPCMIHWNFNHFVVLRGFRGNYAYLNDPARGSIRVSMQEFDRSFTGVCLFFNPSELFERSGRPKKVISFVSERLANTAGIVFFVMLISAVSYFFSILNPGFARFFVDRILTGENKEQLMPFLMILSAVGLLQLLTETIKALNSWKMNGEMAVIGSSTFMWKVLRLPMSFFSQRMAGDIQLRQKANAGIASTMVDTLAPLMINAGMMIFYLAVMLRYNVMITFFGVFSICLNLFLSRLITMKRMNFIRVQMRDEGKLAAATVSGISMIESIKASGTENSYFRKWAAYQASANRQATGFVKVSQYLGIIPAFIQSSVGTVVLLQGVWLCMKGQFSLGMIIAFQSILTSFMNPAVTLINAGQSLQEMRTRMERVEDVMKYPLDPLFSEQDQPEPEKYEKLRGEVELKNVTFGYSRLGEPLIRDFSMHLKPGGSVALVGGSGCGKSTLSKLISGLYQPWSGEILFDGQPSTAVNREIFTGSVAVVDQDVVLFEDTIENNIKMWDPTIEDFEMVLAARDAQIHSDIMQRPGGYQEMLTEGGGNLSGGQRQRLDIARALAQDPHLLIMDEATSALDARTEYELVDAIRQRGISCIVIAHRLSTIRNCDEIIVLDKGRIVERGTHEELYQLGGYYTELISND
ncbi:MAG: NHLP family bacteriocin export ABC transporter peptidase/permease/ATPase subunit [Firmicutes bacterium]|nr:NHLP family bacteriocin export ABC transporter peptidase/permease/ATPase subunit [Bacillota bacterium]